MQTLVFRVCCGRNSWDEKYIWCRGRLEGGSLVKSEGAIKWWWDFPVLVMAEHLCTGCLCDELGFLETYWNNFQFKSFTEVQRLSIEVYLHLKYSSFRFAIVLQKCVNDMGKGAKIDEWQMEWTANLSKTVFDINLYSWTGLKRRPAPTGHIRPPTQSYVARSAILSFKLRCRKRWFVVVSDQSILFIFSDDFDSCQAHMLCPLPQKSGEPSSTFLHFRRYLRCSTVITV